MPKRLAFTRNERRELEHLSLMSLSITETEMASRCLSRAWDIYFGLIARKNDADAFQIDDRDAHLLADVVRECSPMVPFH